MWRSNWTITSSTQRFQPERDAADLERARRMKVEEVGTSLFVRTERQTLRRLPATGAILFTIKVYLDPLCSLAAQPRLAADLKSAIESLTPQQRAYKSLPDYERPLLGYLDKIASTRVHGASTG